MAAGVPANPDESRVVGPDAARSGPEAGALEGEQLGGAQRIAPDLPRPFRASPPAIAERGPARRIRGWEGVHGAGLRPLDAQGDFHLVSRRTPEEHNPIFRHQMSVVGENAEFYPRVSRDGRDVN